MESTSPPRQINFPDVLPGSPDRENVVIGCAVIVMGRGFDNASSGFAPAVNVSAPMMKQTVASTASPVPTTFAADVRRSDITTLNGTDEQIKATPLHRIKAFRISPQGAEKCKLCRHQHGKPVIKRAMEQRAVTGEVGLALRDTAKNIL